MNREAKVRALLRQALRILDEEAEGSGWWHVSYQISPSLEDDDAETWEITSSIEDPNGGLVKRSLNYKMELNQEGDLWELHSQALRLGLDTFTSQPTIPVDEAVTIHIKHGGLHQMLLGSAIYKNMPEKYFERVGEFKYSDSTLECLKLFLFLLRLMKDVKLEMD